MNKRLFTAASTFGAATMVFGAAALAQTPSPGTTVTPSASVTAGSTASAGSTGTAVITGTVSASQTPVSTVTVPPLPIAESIYVPGGGPFAFASTAFERVWNRTDRLVKDGKVSRTYFWGPGPNTPGLLEQYNEAPSGQRQRLVQYFDKSRMELNNPAGNPTSPFFVTNGLLTVELISGFIQVGDDSFNPYHPACIPMSGDFGDNLAPTYFAFQKVANSQAGNHFSTDKRGQKVTDTIDSNGNVSSDPNKSGMTGTELVQFIQDTKHNIPAVFWNFLNSSGPVLNNNGQTVNEQLNVPWNYAAGFPISEPYWARAIIKGKATDVLIQAYQRRALTYVPTNPQGFQVEVANIGQHYFDWRYRNAGFCTGQPLTTPTPPLPAPTSTAVSGTPQATGTAQTTGTVVPRATTTPAAVTTTPTPKFTPVGTPIRTPVGTPPPFDPEP